jgi:T4-like virus Myoviridae tail sheath stabiliser
MAVQFSYDAQVRRFVLQFIRMLSNFQVEFGQDRNGNTTLQTVPIYYGDVSRQAAMILKGNSENTLNAVPAMATYISALTYDRERVLNPTFEGTIRVREQVYDQASQQYTGTQDGLYTVERLMPAPYKLTMKVDVWTSNTEQKHQLFEQIAPLFNPALEIQNSDNYVDWGSLSAVFLTDVSYTNRSVPMVGDDATIDIMSMTFEMPIWISLPAKVKKMGVVAEIIASIYSSNGELSPDVVTTLEGLVSQQRFNPMNYDVVLDGNSLTLYQVANDINDTVHGVKVAWGGLVNIYGKLTNGISQVRLRFNHTDGIHEIVGTVAYDPLDSYSLLFTPIAGTLPTNTLAPVNAIIDPYKVSVDNTPYGTVGTPNGTQSLLTPAAGTRYLILNPIGGPESASAVAWAGTPGTNLIANANDIIEYNGSYWTVAFDSTNDRVQYVTNLNTITQYYWNGYQWSKSVEGLYQAGEWSLIL